jgi:hypothetical protein
VALRLPLLAHYDLMVRESTFTILNGIRKRKK